MPHRDAGHTRTQAHNPPRALRWVEAPRSTRLRIARVVTDLMMMMVWGMTIGLRWFATDSLAGVLLDAMACRGAVTDGAGPMVVWNMMGSLLSTLFSALLERPAVPVTALLVLGMNVLPRADLPTWIVLNLLFTLNFPIVLTERTVPVRPVLNPLNMGLLTLVGRLEMIYLTILLQELRRVMQALTHLRVRVVVVVLGTYSGPPVTLVVLNVVTDMSIGLTDPAQARRAIFSLDRSPLVIVLVVICLVALCLEECLLFWGLCCLHPTLQAQLVRLG